MPMTTRLESLTRTYLSPPAARIAKYVAVYPRYLLQAQACRRGYRQYGHRYPQKVLFIAGLPKSGTTWLEKMLTSYPGFEKLLIPDVTAYELRAGGSHDYDMPPTMFKRFQEMLVCAKMYGHGSPHNIDVLRRAGVHYVILYRDIRDVAVSHIFYVQQTPWHPEYPIYGTLPIQEGLAVFADLLLRAYARWVRSWLVHRDPDKSIVVRYEDLRANPFDWMTTIAQHFELDSTPETIRHIIEANSFQKLSKGRRQGEEDTRSFFRKGVSGDWKNHFTPALKKLYKERAGDIFVELGYEQDQNW